MGWDAMISLDSVQVGRMIYSNFEPLPIEHAPPTSRSIRTLGF